MSGRQPRPSESPERSRRGERMRSRRLVIALWAVLFCLPALPGGAQEDPYREKRQAMVRDEMAGEGISDPGVLAAMREVPRHLLVPVEYRPRAYDPRPLPIGEWQTISQPYVVAFMTEILRLKPGDRVLEVGTGSGYQAAIAARIAGEVYTVEIFPSLADRARRDLESLGLRNVFIRQGDGYYGWEEKAPFDAIIVTCAGGHIPPPLLRQLKNSGRVVIPFSNPFFFP